MSYDHRLLFDTILLSLRRKPSVLLMDLSRELRISEVTIRKAVGVGARKTFRRLREEILLDQVRILFASRSTCTVKEIAFGLGYKSPSSFTRAVKRACGCSPEQLRLRIGQSIARTQGVYSLSNWVPATWPKMMDH
jgi:AraC-like DNA-binding protein